MHVCHVTRRYPPSDGDVARYVHALACRQAAAGHRVTVVTADGGPGRAVFEVADGVSVRRFDGLGLHDGPSFVPGLGPALEGLADLVHVHDYHGLPFVQAALAADVPVVATPQYRGPSVTHLGRLAERAYRPFGGRALARAAAVVAVSHWERRRLVAEFDVDATVVPTGVDARFVATRRADALDRDRPYLLSVGPLVAGSGVDHAVRALTSLPEYDLLVAGTGPERAALRDLARSRGLAHRVTFLGDGCSLPGLYAGASATLALSGVDPAGRTVGQSLATGTPAVVRAARGLRDWVDREDCVDVTVPTPRAVAAAVERAVALDCDVPSRPVSTWDDCAAGVTVVYERVVGRVEHP
ncbi:glycosyltransferase family 4 protein [Halomarina rubra]|uniref:Glycosyltransferase family 4 protein n=1 Tax=Halomarina rubra TaxID=2071873 RepID=A0ABD6B1R4_9EURY|nr:glycosyltransferase family 4 protein [Halomarina rubra]